VRELLEDEGEMAPRDSHTELTELKRTSQLARALAPKSANEPLLQADLDKFDVMVL